jgi:hypothetical protein
MTKMQLVERVLRNFGAPMVKIELKTVHILDAIDYARDKFIKYASGAATHDTYFTIALEANKCIYDLPVGTTDVLSYDSGGSASGINTLFTVDNYLYSRGMFSLLGSFTDDYTLVSYHLAMDFMETLKKYTPDSYNFKYHPYTNQLEIQPAPPSGSSLTYTPRYVNELGVEVAGEETTIDSPGFILIRAAMLEGSTLSPTFAVEDAYDNFYGSLWIIDYATAYAKKTLGMIRRKFNSFGSLGNQGIALDGSELIAEANDEMERLMADLTGKEATMGYGILIG